MVPCGSFHIFETLPCAFSTPSISVVSEELMWTRCEQRCTSTLRSFVFLHRNKYSHSIFQVHKALWWRHCPTSGHRGRAAPGGKPWRYPYVSRHQQSKSDRVQRSTLAPRSSSIRDCWELNRLWLSSRRRSWQPALQGPWRRLSTKAEKVSRERVGKPSSLFSSIKWEQHPPGLLPSFVYQTIIYIQ